MKVCLWVVSMGDSTLIFIPACGLVFCRQAWQALGDLPREKAMAEFVQQLDAKSTLFKPYVQAHKAEQEEMKRKQYGLV